jgi:hypothetical protein
VGEGRSVLAQTNSTELGNFLFLADPLHLTLKLLVCAKRFCRLIAYRGNVAINLTLDNIRGERMLFLPNVILALLDQDDYRCYENVVSGTLTIAAENLMSGLVEAAAALISQICWSFWQSPNAFPADAVQQYVQQMVRDIGQL